MKIPIVICVILASSCRPHQSDHLKRVAAKKLNDSALKYFHAHGEKELDIPISLFTEATETDVKYLPGYRNVIDFAIKKRDFNLGILTAKRIDSIWPGNCEHVSVVAVLYAMNNENEFAALYYKKAIGLMNKALDTITSKQAAEEIKFRKGICVKLAGDSLQGNELLKALSSETENSGMKWSCGSLIKKTKEEIIDGYINPRY
jgi:hypothetical protein